MNFLREIKNFFNEGKKLLKRQKIDTAKKF